MMAYSLILFVTTSETQLNKVNVVMSPHPELRALFRRNDKFPVPGQRDFSVVIIICISITIHRVISNLFYMSVSNLPSQISIWSCSKTKLQIDRLSNTSQISILRFIESNIPCQTPYYRPSLEMYFYIFRSYLSAFYTYIYICIYKYLMCATHMAWNLVHHLSWE